MKSINYPKCILLFVTFVTFTLSLLILNVRKFVGNSSGNTSVLMLRPNIFVAIRIPIANLKSRIPTRGEFHHSRAYDNKFRYYAAS